MSLTISNNKVRGLRVTAVKPQIVVTALSGSTVTARRGTTVLTATEDNGKWTFDIPEFGRWSVTAAIGETIKQEYVQVFDIQPYTLNLKDASVYGIRREIANQSPEWERTDNAVGKTATASVGTVAGTSDFDNCYPWSGIKRVSITPNTITQVMVYIPEFWYRRFVNGGYEYIQIADKEIAGFAIHPGSGVYVGAYKASLPSNIASSRSGYTPAENYGRQMFRSYAKNNGEGWGIIDASANSAIQMLFMVEFATNNGQSVLGIGYNISTSQLTGTCDNVPNLTGRPAGEDGSVSVIYRGIEDIWGYAGDWLDGINIYNGTYYVCTDPSKYGDNTSAGYTPLSYAAQRNWNSSYITQLGLDENVPWAMLPVSAGEGSDSTYYCDVIWTKAEWAAGARGGYRGDGTKFGLFSASLSLSYNYNQPYVTGRIMYRPQ